MFIISLFNWEKHEFKQLYIDCNSCYVLQWLEQMIFSKCTCIEILWTKIINLNNRFFSIKNENLIKPLIIVLPLKDTKLYDLFYSILNCLENSTTCTEMILYDYDIVDRYYQDILLVFYDNKWTSIICSCILWK